MEKCRLLEQKRKGVEKGEMREWRTRHSRNKITNKKEKGPVEPGKEEEEDKLESFFSHLYEFHNPVQVAPAFVPAELPARYSIAFVPASVPDVSFVPTPVPAVSSVPVSVPAVSTPFSDSAIPNASSTDYSVISSINFVVPDPSSSSSFSSTCIETT